MEFHGPAPCPMKAFSSEAFPAWSDPAHSRTVQA